MTSPDELDALVAAVCENAKYARINAGLMRTLAEKELSKGRSHKDTVKAVRNKLHQIAGSYQEQSIDYAQWISLLEQLPRDLSDPSVRQFCRDMMRTHASTRERLPSIDHFYADTLSGLPPITSLLDLACGLNPLSLPWLPLAPGAHILACDIYIDMIAFLGRFFNQFGLNARAETCDLLEDIPQQPVQLALLLKTIPCLEQVDKSIGRRLLAELRADIVLVSFPVHSLSGRGKGMRQFYESHFYELISGQNWRVARIEFSGELVFRLERP